MPGHKGGHAYGAQQAFEQNTHLVAHFVVAARCINGALTQTGKNCSWGCDVAALLLKPLVKAPLLAKYGCVNRWACQSSCD